MGYDRFNEHVCANTVRRAERAPYVNEGRVEDTKDIHLNKNENRQYEIKDDICGRCELRCKNEHGGQVYADNIQRVACNNMNFRESIWTGKYLQMTVMSIARGDDIGVELHKDTDQYIRVEHGYATVLTGDSADNLCDRYQLYTGDAVFIPAGKWHNIVNAGRCALKLSSVYAPPHHPRCTVEKNKN